MMELLSRFEIAVVVGVVDAAVLVLLARALGPRREMHVYTVVLVLTAVAYLIFGLRRDAPPAHLAVEAAGAVVYTLLAVLGGWRWPLLLAVGWTGHVAWDLFLHHAPGVPYAPPWYPALCVGFDLLLGGYIGGVVGAGRRMERR